MKQEQIINKSTLVFMDYPVLKAYLFGSFARDEATATSDVDILINMDMDRVITGMEFFDLWQNLENSLSRPVDLVTTAAISKHILEEVEQDKILIYEIMKKKKPSDKARLNHILDAILKIDKFTANYDEKMFIEDERTLLATLKLIEIIGEAVYHLTKDLKAAYSDIEWRKIEAMRHRLVHEYYATDSRIVWRVAKNYLSPLKEGIEKILEDLTEK